MLKKKNGFTLMELVIVLIILGILAAVGIPTYTYTIEKKRGEVCINNIRMILAAWKIYNDKQAAPAEYYDPGATFQPLTAINASLSIYIDERNFGRENAGVEFQLDYSETPGLETYLIQCERLTGGYTAADISCTLVYSTNPKTITYTWSGPWFDNFPKPN